MARCERIITSMCSTPSPKGKDWTGKLPLQFMRSVMILKSVQAKVMSEWLLAALTVSVTSCHNLCQCEMPVSSQGHCLES